MINGNIYHKSTKNKKSSFDIITFIVVLFLTIIGIFIIYSASKSRFYSNPYLFAKKQTIWFLISSIAMFVIYKLNIQFDSLKKISNYIFWLSIGMLIFTLMINKGQTTSRWLKLGGISIQISEFTKIAYIFFIASFLEKYNSSINSFKTLFLYFFYLLISFVLVLKQPDLGTAIVYSVISIGTLFLSNLKKIIIFSIIALGFPAVFVPLYAIFFKIPIDTKLIIYFLEFNATFLIISYILLKFFKKKPNLFKFVLIFGLLTFSTVFTVKVVWEKLKPYQKKRLITFIDPESSKLDAGYNIIQSKIAIGSGGFFGKGFLKGTQTQYQYLPEAHTDFIFSAFSEEFGFVGILSLFMLYLILFLRMIYISTIANSLFKRYIVIGIFFLFLFHFFENIGMAMGVMPVTGLPLLFISYGGSSLLISYVCIGLLLWIYKEDKE